MNKSIFIIGMSGAGKTAWGEKVAKQFELPFFDMDHYLEKKLGMSITQMFTVYGEQGFRELETEALHEIIRDNKVPIVLSCGGGTPVSRRNLETMKEQGRIIYLKAEIPTLLKNLEGELHQRPLLNSGVVIPAVRLTELYERRKEIYEQADYTLQVENLSIQDFEPILQACTDQR